MTFNLAAQNPPVIAKNVAEQPLDKWDSDAVQYHKSYANASSFGNSPYSLRHQRHELLRKLRQRVRGFDVAAVLYQRQLGSIRERRVGVLSERRVFLGVSLSLGLDPLPLRQLVFLSGSGLGLAARRRLDGTGKQYLCTGSLGNRASRTPSRPLVPGHRFTHRLPGSLLWWV